MGKKLIKNLTTMLCMVVMVVLNYSCELATLDTTSSEESAQVRLFDYDTYENYTTAGANFTITIGTQTVRGKIVADCSHENENYAGPKDVDLAYSQQRTTHGSLETRSTLDTDTKKVKEVFGKTTAQEEDGNLLYCTRTSERITLITDGVSEAMPYIEMGEPRLEAINCLPGTTTRSGEEFKADSVCRQPVWVIPCQVKGVEEVSSGKPLSFELRVRDLFKVYQMDTNDIVSAKKVDVDRNPINDTDEQCDILIQYTDKKGDTHDSKESIILKRLWTPKDEWEEKVDNFEVTWRNANPWSYGSASQKRVDGNFTVEGRTDEISALHSNGVNSFTTPYTFYHEKATYKNKYGVEHTFDFITPAVTQRSTYLSDAQKSGATAKRYHDGIGTTYLKYNQDVEETVLLYKENAHVTSEGWDKSASKETTTTDKTVWYLKYVINYSDGTKDIYEWTVTEPRWLKYAGPWSSIEANNKCTPMGVTVTKTSSTPVSKQDNGATITYNREGYEMVENVALAGSTQKDVWTSSEGNGFSAEFHNRKISFDTHNVKATTSGTLGSGSADGNYTAYPWGNTLRYEFNSDVQNSKGTGTVKVANAEPEEKTFFPPEWGTLFEVVQTVTNNKNHSGYVYCWSLHFSKGVLPVIIAPGSKTPDWQFSYFEWTDNFTYNSATYVTEGSKGTWVNTKATDQRSQMTWSRDSKEYANKAYSVAKDQKWDEGHLVTEANGAQHASVTTSRYDLKVADGRLTATDTYTGAYMGSWK
jgi:hypothetical protein